MIEELKESVQEEGLASITPQGGNAMTSIENAGLPIGNIVEQQETARNASEAQLIEYAKSPQPNVIPPYLVTAELMRRKNNRDKQAKAPQFTVAQDVVQQAEQGIMAQMQQMAPKMPPGGYTPPREQVTREQIMAKGLPQLPNPGQPTMTGFAEGGKIGFAKGGNEGLYFPNQRLTDNYSVSPYTTDFGKPLLRQPYVNPREENYKKNQAISALEDQIETINKKPSTLDSINLEKELISQLNTIKTTPVKGGGYEYTDEETLRLSQPNVLGGSEDDSISIDESIKVAGNEPDLTGLPDFTGMVGEIKGDSSFPPPSPYTRLEPGEEAQAAQDYFTKALGTNPAQAELLAYIKDKEAKTTERLAKDRKMNVANSLLRASKPFFEAGSYGSKIGSAIATGGQSYIEGEKRIMKDAESFEDKMFALKQAEKQAARTEKIATTKFGANSYQSAQAFNRKVEIQEQQDLLKSQQIKATKDLKDAQISSTLALARFQRQIGRDNINDASKVGEIASKIKERAKKDPRAFGLDINSAMLIQFDENKEKNPERRAKIIAAKKKFEDMIAKDILENEQIRAIRGQNTQTATVGTYSPTNKLQMK